MRVLVYSPAFLPSLGGLETVTADLAHGLSTTGDEVAVVSRTAASSRDDVPFAVVRNPSAVELLRWHRWSEVVLHQNLSLRGLWPLLLVRRPLVVSHHGLYRRSNGQIAWQDRLKRAIVRRAAGSISVSRAVAEGLGVPSIVVPNGYQDERFVEDPSQPQDRELLFVGRLVSVKGVDLLIEALARLARRGLQPTLTVVGDGPERRRLEELVTVQRLDGQVEFLGALEGDALVRAYRSHKILVVPSRDDEPFGIVALEGIACGCVVVGSSGGGLGEAIGDCGLTFPNADVDALVLALATLLTDSRELKRLRGGAGRHLARHTRRSMAARYREILAAAVEGSVRRPGTNGASR